MKEKALPEKTEKRGDFPPLFSDNTAEEGVNTTVRAITALNILHYGGF